MSHSKIITQSTAYGNQPHFCKGYPAPGWQPNWAAGRYVKDHPSMKNKNVAAITLGSVSTKASQKAFEKIITNKEANFIGSRSY